MSCMRLYLNMGPDSKLVKTAGKKYFHHLFCDRLSQWNLALLKLIIGFNKIMWKVQILCARNGYMSFRPTPFQPLQFQPLQIQPFTLSTVHTFNRLPFRPLANSTATNSTYLIKFKVIQFFQDD